MSAPTQATAVETVQRLGAFVAGRWKHIPCCFCHASRWTFVGHTSLPLCPLPGHPALPGADVVPLAVIVCAECGYTVTINALVAGLMG